MLLDTIIKIILLKGLLNPSILILSYFDKNVFKITIFLNSVNTENNKGHLCQKKLLRGLFHLFNQFIHYYMN